MSYQIMLQQVLENFTNVGVGLIIFILAYLSNIAFSLYYNVKILGEPFDYHKLINSGLKVLSFCVGVASLVMVVTALPLFAEFVGFAIPEEYVEVFSTIAIISVPLFSACKYSLEAFNKMRVILSKENIEIPDLKKDKNINEAINNNNVEAYD